MPEGPEVRVITDFLVKNFKNSSLSKISIITGRYTKKAPQNLTKLNGTLPAKILNIQNKGKFIYFTLDNDYILWFTLGLTGSFYKDCAGKTKNEQGIEVDKFCRIKLETSKGQLFFSDMRNFGTLAIHPPETSKEALEKKLKTLGPDPLSVYTDAQKDEQRAYFIKKVKSQRNKSKTIGTLLLEQKFISGVGNYVRAIALYHAKISPHRHLSTLTDKDLSNIYDEVYKIEQASYKKQTKSGIHTFKHTVYRKSTDPMGNPIKVDEMPKGRHIYWSPKVQK